MWPDVVYYQPDGDSSENSSTVVAHEMHKRSTSTDLQLHATIPLSSSSTYVHQQLYPGRHLTLAARPP